LTYIHTVVCMFLDAQATAELLLLLLLLCSRVRRRH